MTSSSNHELKVLVGDLLQSKAQTLVNTVNCVGVMGKGIASEFKRLFPDMFEDYARRCEREEVRLGAPYLYRAVFPPQIVNFPTKDHWKSVSRIEDIERGLQYLVEHSEEWEITSLAAPPLGCGNGQLEWREVGPMMYRYLGAMNIPVEFYAPYGTPPKELTKEFLAQPPSRSRGRSIEAARGGLNAAQDQADKRHESLVRAYEEGKALGRAGEPYVNPYLGLKFTDEWERFLEGYKTGIATGKGNEQ